MVLLVGAEGSVPLSRENRDMIGTDHLMLPSALISETGRLETKQIKKIKCNTVNGLDLLVLFSLSRFCHRTRWDEDVRQSPGGRGEALCWPKASRCRSSLRWPRNGLWINHWSYGNCWWEAWCPPHMFKTQLLQWENLNTALSTFTQKSVTAEFIPVHHNTSWNANKAWTLLPKAHRAQSFTQQKKSKPFGF